MHILHKVWTGNLLNILWLIEIINKLLMFALFLVNVANSQIRGSEGPREAQEPWIANPT